MSTDPARALLQFFGGRVCLDFANTMDWRTSEAPQELLPDYATLLLWSGKRGTLPAPAIARLRVQIRQRAAAAARVLEEARVLRAEIWTGGRWLVPRRAPATGALQPAARRSAGAAAAGAQRCGLCSRSAGQIPGGAALARALVAERPAHLTGCRPAGLLSGGRLRLVLRRREPEPCPDLVLQRGLRQSRAGAARLCAADGPSLT